MEDLQVVTWCSLRLFVPDFQNWAVKIASLFIMLESNKKILLELLASSHTAEGQWNVGLGYNSQAHGWTFYTNVTWTWREMQKSVKDCLLPSLEAARNRSLSFANWVLQISYTESVWCWTVYYSNCSNRSLLQTLTITVKAYLETPCLGFWNFCILCGGVWNKQLVLSYCLSSSRINWSGCISYVSLYFFFNGTICLAVLSCFVF